jgi:ubiquinone/menaquinone biosynthesis C-methylase UbiE
MGFYQKKGKMYNRYKADIAHGKTQGKVPIFLKLIKKYSDNNLKALDLGCGSGELAIQLAPNFKEIIGVDYVPEYIKTAEKDRKKFNLKNIGFIQGDARNLIFKNNTFDIVYSSRGPLSADYDFMKESLRVLKKGGLLIEETIGEKDKLEVKKIFGRGQNYPLRDKKVDAVKSLLKSGRAFLLFSKEYIYHTSFRIEEVIKLLERTPIIEDFNVKKDKELLKKLEKQLKTDKGIILSSHRLHWVARK